MMPCLRHWIDACAAPHGFILVFQVARLRYLGGAELNVLGKKIGVVISRVPYAEYRVPLFFYTAAVCRSPDKCQISAAYSRIVRSLENLPMRATFNIALRDQFS